VAAIDAIFSQAACLGRLGRRDVGDAFTAARFQRHHFRPELKYFHFEASSRNSGQSALEFSLVAGSGSLPDGTVTSSVKVTELSEPTGDVMYKYKYIYYINVMNPNTRALVCGTSSTSIKQN